jgi:hypothetical protein
MSKMRKTTDSKDDILEKRRTQIEKVTLKIREINDEYLLIEKDSGQYHLLKSVSSGLYDELDKLCKKSPAEPITDLALTSVNEVIKETKQLIQNDIYIQRISEFIPAGDNPQLRDAVMVMRQITQGSLFSDN